MWSALHSCVSVFHSETSMILWWWCEAKTILWTNENEKKTESKANTLSCSIGMVESAAQSTQFPIEQNKLARKVILQRSSSWHCFERRCRGVFYYYICVCIKKFQCVLHLENRFKIENQFHQLDGTNSNSFRSHIIHRSIYLRLWENGNNNKTHIWFGLLVIMFHQRREYNNNYDSIEVAEKAVYMHDQRKEQKNAAKKHC